MKGYIYYGSFEAEVPVRKRGKIAYWDKFKKCTTYVDGKQEERWNKILKGVEARNKKIVDVVCLGKTNYEI